MIGVYTIIGLSFAPNALEYYQVFFNTREKGHLRWMLYRGAIICSHRMHGGTRYGGHNCQNTDTHFRSGMESSTT